MKSTFAPHSYNTEMPHMILDGACCIDILAAARSPTHWYRITATANDVVIVVSA